MGMIHPMCQCTNCTGISIALDQAHEVVTVRGIARARYHIVGIGCWIWEGPNSNGYGHLTIGHTRFYAHRLIWLLIIGPIPWEADLHHICLIGLCVNPDHLRPLSRQAHRLLHIYLDNQRKIGATNARTDY